MRTLAIGVLVGLVTACSPAANQASPPSTTSSAMSEVQVLALAKETAQCIRNNGLPGFPDPYFENGRLTLPPLDDSVKQQGQAALNGPCHDLWQRLQEQIPEEQRGSEDNDGPMSAEDLEKLKDFTKCMREHGYPQWPDPDERGKYHVGDILGEGNPKDNPTFTAAMASCKQYAVPGMGIEKK